MPIGIVSDEEFAEELDKVGHIQKPEIIKLPTPSRGVGNVEVPESLRKIIGDTAITEGRSAAVDLASRFNVSPSSVSAYSKGATSTASYNKPNKDLLSFLNKRKLKIARSAAGKLSLALENITPEKLEEIDAKDLSTIARNLGGVVKDMTPPSEGDGEQGEGKQPFVIYAPTFVQENKFETIHLEE